MDTALGGRQPETAKEMRSRIGAIFSGSIGNLIEWFDFYIYSFFSLYFAKSFFPGSDPTAQLLSAALVFGLGFLIRPVGGWIMGVYADRAGRKSALTLSVSLMCLGSLIIAMCPTHATIGIWAPTVLVLARLLQGISLGGEYGTSAAYLSEMATPGRRGFYSSFQYVTLIGGQLLATVLLLVQQQLMSQQDLEAWGWRVPFFIGAGVAVFGFWIRRGMAETEEFVRASATVRTRSPMRELLQHPRAILLVFGLTAGGTLAFYTYTTYMPKFLVNSVGLTKPEATLISTCSLFIFMCLQPVFGFISDRIGRRPVLMWFGILGTIGTIPILTALSQTHSAFVAFGLVMAALVIVSGYTSINAVVKAELFPAEIRALGIGLPYAIAVSMFGGSAESIALLLKQAGHENWFYYYVTGMIFISFLVYARMKDTRDHSQIKA